MAAYNTPENELHPDPTLTEIMLLVDMDQGVTSIGWNAETARLFAIDTAMAVVRRNIAVLSEPEKQRLITKLQEARALVVSGRDAELGFLQAAMEANMPLADSDRARLMWLIAIDALLPSPYRAALVTTRCALTLGIPEPLTDVSSLLRDRLLARLGEGSLHSEPTPDLFRIA